MQPKYPFDVRPCTSYLSAPPDAAAGRRQRRVRWAAVPFLLALTLGAARTAEAQDEGLNVRLHGGIVQPIGATADYFKFGPSVALDVGLPVAERVDVMLDLGWDYLNMTDVYATPTTNLWRYRLGLEADLLGDDGDATYLLAGLVEAGATTTRSHNFWLASRRPYTYEGETINQTAVAAAGGFRLGLRTPDDLTWWLTTKLNWSPIQDTNQDALQELSRNELEPLGSSMLLSVTLGVTLW